MRILGFIAAAAPIAALACTPGGSGTSQGFLGESPPPAILLLARDAQISGEPAADAGAPLLDLDTAGLSDWVTTRAEGSLRFASPILTPRGLPGAGRLHLRIRPGGATGVSIVPHPRGDQLVREHRALRRLEIALEPERDPDPPLDLSIDLYEALHGSFGDAGRGGRLWKLEVLLTGADPERAALLGVRVTPRRLLAAGSVAAAIVADHGGVLRPSWAVAGGATVETLVAVPDRAPELRWIDAAAADTGARIIEIEDAGTITTLDRGKPAAGRLGAPWTPKRHTLEAWAGRSVRVRLRVEGGGVGLFGTPVIVSSDPAPAASPDVLVYLIDTLRADHLAAGGHGVAGVSPNLDRLAAEGAWFGRAQSSSPWTKPAIATLMTGIQPPTHRVGATSYTDRLPTTVPLLQERFRDAGWRTGSFTSSPLGSTLSALERGFDLAVPPRFWRERARLDMNPSADQLGETLLDWIAEEPDRAFFAYVHTLEVHEWKLPRYQRGRPPGGSAYDAAIRDADRQLGTLLEGLASRTRPLWVVVVSDHGESWGDHGMPSHGFGLYQSQVHIPLIFWSSTGAARGLEISAPVGLADVGPTLLDGFGLPRLDEADGESLVPALRGETLTPRATLSSLLRFVWSPNAPVQHAITTPEQVSVIRPDAGDAIAFDLVLDPKELRPTEPDADHVRALDETLAEQARRAEDFSRRHGPVVPGPVTLDAAERLKALGYLGDSPPSE